MAGVDSPELKRIRTWIEKVEKSDKEDGAAWEIAVEFVNSGVLRGMSREDIESALGRGGLCGSVSYKQDGNERYFMDSKGFARDDMFYEVGRLPKNCVGGLPTIVIGFEAGRCNRVELIHTQ